MTTNIRRNADGQQNLNDLRKALTASGHMIHRQGGNWITRQWSHFHNAFIEQPMPHWYDERNAIQNALGLEVESKSDAAMYV